MGWGTSPIDIVYATDESCTTSVEPSHVAHQGTRRDCHLRSPWRLLQGLPAGQQIGVPSDGCKIGLELLELFQVKHVSPIASASQHLWHRESAPARLACGTSATDTYMYIDPVPIAPSNTPASPLPDVVAVASSPLPSGPVAARNGQSVGRPIPSDAKSLIVLFCGRLWANKARSCDR